MFVRLILLAVLFCLGYTLYHLWWRGLSSGRRPPVDEPRRQRRNLRQGEEMVQDALDGTYLPLSLAVTAKVGGRTLYFASKANRDHYLAQHKG